MRSKLFVPGSRPELFKKALNSKADAISLDLEDSVLENRKDYARDQLAEFLDDPALALCDKKIIVRINGMGTPHFLADLAVCCHPAVHIINTPKIESPENVVEFFAHLERAEHGKSLAATILLLANIETPKSVRLAGAIATSHARVCGLQLGLGDLFEPAGISRYNTANVHAMMFAVRMAAAEGAIFAFDSAYANVADVAGYREEALIARALGFSGKTCIHPSQVDIANEVFSPTRDEIEWARKVTQAAQANQQNGAFLLDGKMIDAPFIHRAKEVMRNAAKLNSL